MTEVMKSVHPSVLAAIIALAFVQAERSSAEESPAAIAPTSRVELFNGKDFSGWTFCLATNAAPAATFGVTNGVMHCTGQPFGYVRTEKSYRDYKLTVEWRFVKIAPRADNSGVFVHLQPPDKVWPKCIENQGQFRHQGDLILLGGATALGHDTPQTRGMNSRETRNEKPEGEWNTYEVVCVGDTLKSYVNGKLMNEATGCSVSSGAIAIQSENGEWEARKIFLEPAKGL
jgi:3-keto-disaccharide hydrolase